MSKARKISYISICVAAFGLFLTYCILNYSFCFNVIGQAFTDLFDSIGYYFSFVFGIKNPTAPGITVVPPGYESQLPIEWSEFVLALERWWQALWTEENLRLFLLDVLNFLLPASRILMLIVPLIVCLIVILKQYAIPGENTERTNSRALRWYLKFEIKVLDKIKTYISDFVDFVKEQKIIRYSFILVFCLFYNVISIFLEFFAFFFYFVVSYNFVSLYTFVVRTVCNLSPIITLPGIVWVVITLVIILSWRKKKALRFLAMLESKNEKFIKELPIISMSVGTMGSKKTTNITDMTLSAVNVFRDQAKKTMLEKSLLFPNFNWRLFEDDLLGLFDFGYVYSLRSAKWFVKDLENSYRESRDRYYIFDYDVENYPLEVYDGLRYVSLFKAMEDYAQTFFIYTRKSITISNYAIKENSRIEFVGNSPVVTSDFSADDREGEFSHVINFDSLRLGKKYKDKPEDREKRPFFDFGIIVVTEAGKERGNQLDTRGQKRDDDYINQLNDLFNDFIKLIRHRCTVDYFPYAMVFFDDQRPESLGADCRELAYINQIAGSSDVKLAMPFFWVEELLHEWLFPKYSAFNEEYNFFSGKKNLLYYLYTKMIAKLHNYYVRTYNRYGYYTLMIEQQSGKMDGKIINKHYHLSRKKDLADVFATDCYGEYLANIEYQPGIDSLPYYNSVVPTCEEYNYQNSHLIENKLKKYEQGSEKDE